MPFLNRRSFVAGTAPAATPAFAAIPKAKVLLMVVGGRVVHNAL